MTVIDAHVHVAALDSLAMPVDTWLAGFPAGRLADLYDADGHARPAVFAAHLEEQGVDTALLFAEYSPRVTGTQRFEDMLPFVEHDPMRFRAVANVNPHVHYPVEAEAARQLDLGAVALKLHPVHAGFPLTLPELVPVYALCAERRVPVIVHAGTSNFPGARNEYAGLDHVVDTVRAVPGCTFVLAHGGRGWSYDQAAFLALTYDNVWIDIAGLPPRRIPAYYARHDLARLAGRFVFGSDWPGLPSIAGNIAAVRAWGLPDELTGRVLAGHARRVFPLG